VADGREDAAAVLARKVFARMYEVTGSLCARSGRRSHPTHPHI